MPTTPATDALIAKNITLSALLGWEPSDFGALDYDALLITMIKAQQALLDVEDDGVAGPVTYKALLAAKQAYLLAHPHQAGPLLTLGQATALTFADRQKVALYELKLLWLETIIDLPPKDSPAYAHSHDWIDALIRTEAGIDWYWESSYTANTRGQGNFEWCGTGPARAYRKVGMPVPMRRTKMPSTYRIDRWARYQPGPDGMPDPKPATGPYRMILDLDETSTSSSCVFPDGTEPRAGDIALVGPVASGPGKHITLVESFHRRGFITTIECNGFGALPSGQKAQGVVRAQRSIGLPTGAPPTTYHVRHVVRLAPADIGIVV